MAATTPTPPSSAGTTTGGTNAKPTNLYTHRQAATPRPCFVCYKATPHVLVSTSLPTLDFLYICQSHLADRHFATRVHPSPSSSTSSTDGGGGGGTGNTTGSPAAKVSPSEIEKVKREYEERMKKREQTKSDAGKEKEKEDAKSTSSSVGGTIFNTLSSAVSAVSSSVSSSLSSPPPPTSSSATSSTIATTDTTTALGVDPFPLHAKYALHREFYAQRVREYANRLAKASEKNLNLPQVPKGRPT